VFEPKKEYVFIVFLLVSIVLSACSSDPTPTVSTTQLPVTNTSPVATTSNTKPSSPTKKDSLADSQLLPVATTTAPVTNSSTEASADKPSPNQILMKDFIGVNQDYRLYQDNTEKDFARVSKWLRDYANWYCLEPKENNYGGVDGTDGCGTKPYFFNYNAFYTNLQAAGIKVLHTSLYAPNFANSNAKDGDYVPVAKEGQGQQPQDFEKHARFLSQITALFGNNKNLPAGTLVKSEQKPGQNLIQAIENWNEPDGWWKGPGLFSKEQFYNMTVADYDGAGGKLANTGVKQVDPNMKFVLAGLATTDLGYLYGLLGYANRDGRKFPADVLNFHQYFTNGTTGLPPEQGGLIEDIQKATRWRDTNVPGAELWVTEFGWDTFARDNEHSRVYASPQNQANWILRSLVLYRAAGVAKAFVFTYNDEEQDSTETYYSSGLTDFSNNKKPSYYYLATMQDLLGETYLDQAISTGRDEVKAYLFREKNKPGGVFTVWKTSGNGSQIENFKLNLPPGSQNCTAVLPSSTSFETRRTPLEITENKQTSLTVSETMTFIVCEKVGTTPKAQEAAAPIAKTPQIATNGRINLLDVNLFETSPTPTDPEAKMPLSNLIDEPKSDPDDPKAPLPANNWFALTPDRSFGLDLQTGLNLKRLAWFNAGGDGSGFKVFYAPPGGYGKWQALTTITNDGNAYGKWMSVSLNVPNIQYLQFVPFGEAKLGEIALYN
jgi:hypothetical protein